MNGADTFPIFVVSAESIIEEEQLGSKDKHWCQLNIEGTEERWLLKIPRQEPGKGEHWAEKLAAEIGGLIGVPCAEVQLARFNEIHATISKTFVETNWALVHGNEIIGGRVMGYDPQKRRRTSDHTFERIHAAILQTCSQDSCKSDLIQFGGYIVLDALIANTDRHHENWGLLRPIRETAGTVHTLAPSFDHASSLGREMRDERRELILRENRLDKYILGGGGAVYLEKYGDRPIPPIQLVQEVLQAHPDYIRPWLSKLREINTAALDKIFARMPPDWMTDAQTRFAKALVLRSVDMLSDAG